RDQCYGPHWREVDLSVFKDFALNEKYKLSFRVKAYNISNTTNFSLPNFNISGWTVSRNPAGIPTTAGAFGQITSTNIGFTPRVIELALKLNFSSVLRAVLKNRGGADSLHPDLLFAHSPRREYKER